MIEFEELGFSITFNSSAIIDDEPENYLISIEGNILCTDDNDNEITAGKLKIFYVDIDGAADAGYESTHILDLEAATEPFYLALFDPKTSEFRQSVYDLVGEDIFGRNLLILDRLEILPVYRGKKLGLACLYRCMQQYWHGCGLVALKCFPLQFEAVSEDKTRDEWRRSLELNNLGKDHKHCRSKLQAYYEQLGFKKLRGTEIMALNPLHKQPTLEDLGFG